MLDYITALLAVLSAYLPLLKCLAIYHIIYLCLQAMLVVVSGGSHALFNAMGTLPMRSRVWFVIGSPYTTPVMFYYNLLRGRKP